MLDFNKYSGLFKSKQSDKTVQKKSYKILDSILESGQPALNEAKNEAIFAYIVEEKFESIASEVLKRAHGLRD